MLGTVDTGCAGAGSGSKRRHCFRQGTSMEESPEVFMRHVIPRERGRRTQR